MIKIRPFQRL